MPPSLFPVLQGVDTDTHELRKFTLAGIESLSHFLNIFLVFKDKLTRRLHFAAHNLACFFYALQQFCEVLPVHFNPSDSIACLNSFNCDAVTASVRPTQTPAQTNCLENMVMLSFIRYFVASMSGRTGVTSRSMWPSPLDIVEIT